MFFDPKLLKSASFALSLAIQAIALTFVGFFFGQWIDGRLSTAPYLQMVCTFSAFAIGMHNLITRLKPKK